MSLRHRGCQEKTSYSPVTGLILVFSNTPGALRASLVPNLASSQHQVAQSTEARRNGCPQLASEPLKSAHAHDFARTTKASGV